MFNIIIQVLGIIGVIMVMLAYFFLETAHLDAHQPVFPLLNLIGSSLILLSLFFDWNFPAFLMEGSWALISIFGLWKALRKKLT